MFSGALKTGVITPAQERGNKLEVSNYCPISILHMVSKIYEKVIAEQLTEHIDKTNIHTHYGLVLEVNISEAVCANLTEEIKCSLDQGGVVGAVFLQVHKAFDTVSHDILLNKVTSYHLSNQTRDWVKSYLSGRQECENKTQHLSN